MAAVDERPRIFRRPAKVIEDMSHMSESELVKREKAIAQRHMGHFPWFSVVWCFANLAVWLSLWPLVFLGVLPLWAAFPIATLNVMLSYLPSHEAQHDIIARPGQKLRWLNELVGHVSIIPLWLPFGVARLTHLEHHKHTNHPEKDPDHSTHADGPLHAIWRSLQNRQPRAEGGFNSYGETLMRLGTPQANRALLVAVLYQLFFFGLMFTLAWSGYAFEAVFLWWLPRHIGLTYIQFYLSWAPHHPAMNRGRYRDTRAWRSRFGNVLTMGMQYHVVHHLYPRIPLIRTPAAYWELRPILEARGVRIDDL
ncbi:MAG: fatty acid desaturase [Pseudomonadota bacterium]